MKLDELEQIISNHYGINDIFVRCREYNIVEARSIFFWICRKKFNEKYSKLSMLYKYDPSTIMNSVVSIENRISYDNNFREKISLILKICSHLFE